MLVNSTIRLAEMTYSVGTKTYTNVKLCTTVSGTSLSSSHTTKARLNANPWITTTCRSFGWFVVSCTHMQKRNQIRNSIWKWLRCHWTVVSNYYSCIKTTETKNTALNKCNTVSYRSCYVTEDNEVSNLCRNLHVQTNANSTNICWQKKTAVSSLFQ